MLSENEKEAIEYLKSNINYNKNRIKEIENKDDTSLIGYGTIHDAYKLQNCQYLILLNLITNLEKSNKKLKDNNKSLLKKLRNRIQEVKKLTKYALYKKEFTNLNKIIKEKDNNIKEINDYLENISQDLDNVAIDQIPIAIAELKYDNEFKDKQIDLMIEEYEYYDRINLKNFCEDELRKDKCIQDCKNCAKKYFEQLAKKKGE